MVAHNLPHYATPFVGRLSEINEIVDHLKDANCRLLTLIGPGGIGKTRLAVEVVENLPDNFSHGIHFVNFQPVASTDVLASTIADVLNIPLSGQEPPLVRLLNFLHEKEMLLVLDNLEHLLDGIEWISALLEHTPGIKLLTTSREALKLQEEWLYPLSGLSFPASTDEQSIEHYEAVQIFLQSARRVQPRFVIANGQAGLVRICRQAEGIPLALEMAASWVNVLSCEQIADEMQHSLDFLIAAARNAPKRHRSMRAVFDHSWRLLDENERRVLRALSVFRGGFTLDAAEQVGGASLSVLAVLTEKSLVRRLPSGRYDMHELLRQFADEKLGEVIEEKVAVQDRHCAYYVEFLHRLTRDMRVEREFEAMQAIEAELDNVRACWERAVEQVNVAAFRKCEETLRVFYHVVDRFHEGEEAFGRAAAALEQAAPGDERDVTLALLYIGQGKFCLRIGQHQRAKALLEDSVAILRRYGTSRELGWALYDLGRVLHEREEYREATQVQQETLALAEAMGEEVLVAWSYFELSCTVRMYGDYLEALRLMQESVPRLIRTGDQDGIALGLRGLADRLKDRGEYTRAKQLYLQSIAIHRKLDYKTKLSTSLEGLGSTLFALGDYEAARGLIEESLTLARELGFPRRLAFALIYLGNVVLALGHSEEARLLFHESLTIATQTAEPWQQALSLRGLGRVAFRQGQYADARQFYLDSLSLSQKSEFRLEIATSLGDLGRVAVVQGQMPEAKQFFGEALSIGLEIQIAPVVLEIFIGIAEWFSMKGEPARAMALLMMVRAHPASHQEMKDRAAEILTLIAQHPSSELPTRRRAEYVLKRTKSYGEIPDLDTVARRLYDQLKQPKVYLLSEAEYTAKQAAVDALSEREVEILCLLADGFTNQEIAEQLTLVVGTIKAHNNHIFSKLGVSNRVQAIVRARELGLI